MHRTRLPSRRCSVTGDRRQSPGTEFLRCSRSRVGRPEPAHRADSTEASKEHCGHTQCEQDNADRTPGGSSYNRLRDSHSGDGCHHVQEPCLGRRGHMMEHRGTAIRDSGASSIVAGDWQRMRPGWQDIVPHDVVPSRGGHQRCPARGRPTVPRTGTPERAPAPVADRLRRPAGPGHRRRRRQWLDHRAGRGVGALPSGLPARLGDRAAGPLLVARRRRGHGPRLAPPAVGRRAGRRAPGCRRRARRLGVHRQPGSTVQARSRSRRRGSRASPPWRSAPWRWEGTSASGSSRWAGSGTPAGTGGTTGPAPSSRSRSPSGAACSTRSVRSASWRPSCSGERNPRLVTSRASHVLKLSYKHATPSRRRLTRAPVRLPDRHAAIANTKKRSDIASGLKESTVKTHPHATLKARPTAIQSASLRLQLTARS